MVPSAAIFTMVLSASNAPCPLTRRANPLPGWIRSHCGAAARHDSAKRVCKSWTPIAATAGTATSGQPRRAMVPAISKKRVSASPGVRSPVGSEERLRLTMPVASATSRGPVIE